MAKGFVVALALLCGAVPGIAGAANGAQPMTVVLADNRFEPDHLSFHAGQAYDLRLENRGKELHEFTAPAFLRAAKVQDKKVLSNGGGDIVVHPGQTVEVRLIAPPAGHYDLTCADHDWDGMVGDITVEP